MSDREDQDGLGPMRAVIEGGKSVEPKAPKTGDDASAEARGANHFPAGGGRAIHGSIVEGSSSDHRLPPGVLPQNCPVTPLGLNGDVFYYLDGMGQLMPLEAGKHGRSQILAMFAAHQDLLYRHWPRTKKIDDGLYHITGWMPEKVHEALVAQCAEKGLFDAFGRVRGPGAWRGEDGELILHVGDALYRGGEVLTPRPMGRYVYPSAPPVARPADQVSEEETTNALKELLTLLLSWNWRRPELDPYLLLGWIGAAMIGGALDWRPTIWTTGDAATGKSTLHEVIQLVMDEALISVTDTTAAGIWQKLGMSSLAVAIDEIEADADNRKANGVIELARAAASGGVTLRGGADHKGSEFKSQSCFFFSSILIPPLKGQDRSRMGILELQELEPGAKAPVLEAKALRRCGALIRSRLLREWPQVKERIQGYKLALAGVGHSGRGADVFGTLLGVADLLLEPSEPSQGVYDGWAEKCRADALVETAENEANHQSCIGHLLTSPTDVRSSGRPQTVGELLVEATGDSDSERRQAQAALEGYGLKLINQSNRSSKYPYAPTHMAVANNHRMLGGLFADSMWAAGVWSQAMGRIPGAERSQMRFSGTKSRCVMVPLSALLDAKNDTMQAAPAAGAHGDDFPLTEEED